MKKKEILDVVDENGKKLGEEDRETLHNKSKKIHPVAHILVVNTAGKMLIQQRSFTKRFGPGLWEISAGGHIDAKEKPEEAARRELKEELGIVAPVQLLSKEVFRYPEEGEYSYLYLVRSDGPFLPDRREIEKVRFVTFEEAKKLLKRNKEPSVLELWLPTIKERLRDVIQ
jgi:mutator protein MutT